MIYTFWCNKCMKSHNNITVTPNHYLCNNCNYEVIKLPDYASSYEELRLKYMDNLDKLAKVTQDFITHLEGCNANRN